MPQKLLTSAVIVQDAKCQTDGTCLACKEGYRCKALEWCQQFAILSQVQIGKNTKLVWRPQPCGKIVLCLGYCGTCCSHENAANAVRSGACVLGWRLCPVLVLESSCRRLRASVTWINFVKRPCSYALGCMVRRQDVFLQQRHMIAFRVKLKTMARMFAFLCAGHLP